jgi:hypothetical protein
VPSGFVSARSTPAIGAETGQHLSTLAQIRYPEIVAADVFDANVSHRNCDMRNIPAELNGFDFNWSFVTNLRRDAVRVSGKSPRELMKVAR